MDGAELHGDVKSFFTATCPYESAFLPPDPSGQGVLDFRLKATYERGPFSAEVHHAVTALTAAPGGFSSTGLGASAPEAVDLSWEAFDADLTLRGRVDRLVIRGETTGLEVAVGRQAVGFGTGMFFTPLDLVNPFTPAVVDQEYRPGVDAVRVDGYPSATSRITAVGAYAGDWSLAGTVLAATGSATVGVTDLGGFAGLIHEDLVLGATTATSVGPVGLHADAAVTVPPESEDPFVRAVVGGLWKPAEDTTLTAEAYVQTLNWGDPPFAHVAEPRYLRGELWLSGNGYGAVALAQQVTPLISASLAVIGAVDPDRPSVLLAPSLGWSVAENAEVGVGGFAGLGARPDGLAARSEFGTWPAAGFANVRAYF
jgi:hypothetical protein